MEKVAAVQCRTYEADEVYASIKKALDRIGYVLPESQTVLIKPNLFAQNRPEQHSITHYSVVEALCRLLKEKGSKIFIGDSVAFYQKGLTRKAFETSRIGEVAEKYDAELIPFEEQSLIKVAENIVGLKEIYVPEILFQVDQVINLCKLKTHSSLRFSGAVKNMFGCLPGGYKQKIHSWTSNHFELSDVFLNLHKIIKPAVSIMDAIVSLDGGPAAIGKPVKTDTIFASTNAAALDVVACRAIGYEPEDISTLIQARIRNMIQDYKEIEILGEIKPRQFKHLKKGAIEEKSNKNSIFVKDTYVNPFIKEEKCNKYNKSNRCNKCMELCSSEAIESVEGKVLINPEKCINCYRCLEVCPVEAISIRASWMNKLIRGIRCITKL